jgi:hypothetical protein
MYVTNTDQSSFPAEGSDFSDYVGGISDYDTASGLWSLARSGYLVTSSKQAPGKDLTQLPWYISENTELNSAYKYLDKLIRWTSRQHINSSYAIPLTSGNLNINLTDTVNFNDYLYTNDNNYYGWVQKVEFDTKKDQIKVGIYIDPDAVRADVITAGRCDTVVTDRSAYNIYDATDRSDPTIIIRREESYGN